MRPPTAIRRWIRRMGYDVIRFTPRSSPLARRLRLFDYHKINVVLDVGANQGAYGEELRETGFSGKIVSFEPQSQPFSVLQQKVRRDPLWSAVNVGLGAHTGESVINVSANTESSSFLPIKTRHVTAYPEAAYVGTETVKVLRLDDVYSTHCQEPDRVFLKMDAQGYEMRILEGAVDNLSKMTGVQVEISLVPLYQDQAQFAELVHFLEKHGLTLMSVQPVVEDPASGQLLAIDGLFFRDAT